MLVVSRKKGEAIVIGSDILVEIVGLSKSRVSIGIKAPPETRILRKEIADGTVRKDREKGGKDHVAP